MSVTFYCAADNGPEVNLSNAHARLQLDLFGIRADDLAGRVPHADIPSLLRRYMIASATGAAQAAATPGYVEQLDDGPTVMHYGIDGERIADAQQRLAQLFAWAARHGVDVLFG